MQNRQIHKSTKQVRIGIEVHRQLKIQAAKAGKPIKTLLEELLNAELFGNRQEPIN